MRLFTLSLLILFCTPVENQTPLMKPLHKKDLHKKLDREGVSRAPYNIFCQKFNREQTQDFTTTLWDTPYTFGEAPKNSEINSTR